MTNKPNPDFSSSCYDVVVFKSEKGFFDSPSGGFTFDSLSALEEYLFQIPMTSEQEGRLFVSINGEWYDVWGFGSWSFNVPSTAGVSKLVDWPYEGNGSETWWTEELGFLLIPLIKKALDRTCESFDTASFVKHCNCSDLLNLLSASPTDAESQELFQLVEEFIMGHSSSPLVKSISDVGITPAKEFVHLLKEPKGSWECMGQGLQNMPHTCFSSICEELKRKKGHPIILLLSNLQSKLDAYKKD